MNENGDIIIIKKDIEILKNDLAIIKEDISELKNYRMSNLEEKIRMDKRLEYAELYQREHKDYHEKLLERNNQKNWQMWFLVITVIITGVGGLIFGLLKGA